MTFQRIAVVFEQETSNKILATNNLAISRKIIILRIRTIRRRLQFIHRVHLHINVWDLRSWFIHKIGHDHPDHGLVSHH